jgi:SAM-dependent methyltransferase
MTGVLRKYWRAIREVARSRRRKAPSPTFDFQSVVPANHHAFPPWNGVLPLPSEALMYAVGAPSIDNFLLVGEAWFQLITKDLPPDGTILDLGCGCGRTARFLLNLRSLNYVGIDIFRASIDWCSKAFPPFTGDRFTFLHFDGHSDTYNPNGRVKTVEYRLPIESGTIDYAFAASLFTHLLEPDAKHYLAELSRVLRKDGKALLSTHVAPPSGYEYFGSEDRIEVSEHYFTGLARAAGLEEHEVIGDVCGQHTILFAKR